MDQTDITDEQIGRLMTAAASRGDLETVMTCYEALRPAPHGDAARLYARLVCARIIAETKDKAWRTDARTFLDAAARAFGDGE